ncbi:MAG: molybdenum cofactor guanylyltransferase [Elainellaceae cyanobacterium]
MTVLPVAGVTALILAGGQSRRMRQDKALMPIDGRPLLRLVYDAAAQCCSQVAVVTPWGDRYRPHLPETCVWISEPQPAPGSPAPGPLVGFLHGLAEVRSPWILLLACDLPRLNAPTLQSGMAHLGSLPPPVQAFLPRSSKGWEPLCGFYRQDCRTHLQGFVARGGRSFQQWLGEMGDGVRAWVTPDDRILFNCNTPADLHQLRD